MQGLMTMNTLTQRLLIAASAAVLAGASTLAMARGGNDCGPMGGMGADMPNGPRAEKMQARMGEQMAKRQADLKAKLQLSAEQEGAWTSFTAAMTPPNMANMPRLNPAEMQALTTPQRMEKMQAMKAERDAHMSKRMEATKAFYAALTPEQQKVFDAQTMRGMHGGQGGSPPWWPTPGLICWPERPLSIRRLSCSKRLFYVPNPATVKISGFKRGVIGHVCCIKFCCAAGQTRLFRAQKWAVAAGIAVAQVN
jgi:protein CpxP